MNTPTDSDPDPEPSKSMGFWEHLEELRGTIIKSGVVFVLFAGLIGYHLPELNRTLMASFKSVAAEHPGVSITMGTTSPAEGVNVLMQVCFYGGLLLSAPFTLFFIGQFVAPALTEREKGAIAPLCGAAFVLFLAGAAFGYFLLVPGAVRAMIEIDLWIGWEDIRWTVGSYYQLLVGFTLGVGAAFEFPLLVVLLVWLGVLGTGFLRKYRRHAIVVIMVIAAVVTPTTTDPSLMLLLAAPLYLLYECAIIAAGWVEKHRERNAATVLLGLMALWPKRTSPVGSLRAMA
jgi:sec-independent protein translocase protein TatC